MWNLPRPSPAWNDADYKAELLSDSHAALAEAGVLSLEELEKVTAG